jgi:predicted Zn-dependent protease
MMPENKILRVLEEGLAKVRKARYSFKQPNGQRLSYKPFFVSIGLEDKFVYSVETLNGSLMHLGKNPSRNIVGRVEIRMGNYHEGGGMGSDTFSFPYDLGYDASSHKLWVAMNNSFWQCVEDFGDRNLEAMGSRNKREKYTHFSREPRIVYSEASNAKSTCVKKLTEMARQVSEKLLNKHLWSIAIDIDGNQADRYILNSEGSRLYSSSSRWGIILKLFKLDRFNLVIPHTYVFYVRDPSKLPSKEVLIERGEEMTRELEAIVNSPIQKNGSFPVIMDPKNHGVLWHEVIGHALEATRMKDDEDDEDFGFDASKVCLFLGKRGYKVAPRFISLYDDPTLGGLSGSYEYDSEGVKAQKVTLIKNGVLKNYLHSRASAGFFRTSSNGHARADGRSDPKPRMSNLVVESDNKVSFEELKENLIKECERQHERCGLIFLDCEGGLTLPEESYFQTYPSRVFKVDRRGRIHQVRGIYIVGTPYEAMKNIIQTGDKKELFDGVCGAESGEIPSTTIAPHALIRSLEVNRIPDSSYEEMRHLVVEHPRMKR